MKRGLHPDGGFSLVELLVALAIFAVVGTATSAVAISTLRAQRFATETGAALDQARVAVNRVERDVRGARRIEACANRNLWFWTDLDLDGVEETNERVRYELTTAGRLERWTEAAPARQAVAGNLRTDQAPFTCVTSTPSTVTLSFSTQAVTPGPASMSFGTVVRLRNG